MGDVVIRPLSTVEEMDTVEAVQYQIRGDDPRVIIHTHMLISIARNGGLVLGAYDGEILVGYAVSFLGADMSDPNRPAMANLQLYSKRVEVLEAYRSQNIGYRLKLAQREFARARGIRLITWTFDPLLSRNAHFNVRKLGCFVSRFYPDYYGPEAPSLTILGSSDRFQADWWITSRRVEERLGGSRGPLTLQQYLSAGTTTLLNPTSVTGDGLPFPAQHNNPPGGVFALLEIPVDYERLAQASPDLGQAWRAHSRDVLTDIFRRGYIVTDFLHEEYEGRLRSFYLFGLNNNGDMPSVFSRN